jgi:PAS domain S-box-containing protein
VAALLAFVVVTLTGVVWLARRSAKRAAELAEAKFREIFENSVEGIYQCTPDGKFLTVNPATARIYGVATTQELLGQPTNGLGRREEFTQLMHEHGAVREFESQLERADEFNRLVRDFLLGSRATNQ